LAKVPKTGQTFKGEFNDVTIEKNIPVPQKPRFTVKAYSKFPFDQLEVGDSFCVPCRLDAPNMQTSISVAANTYTKKGGKGKCFTIRTVIENGAWGVRCWRTA
jgi:hypothetical protein